MLAAEAAVGRLLTSAERADWPAGELRAAFVISGTRVLSAWHCVQAIGGKAAEGWLRLQPRSAAEEYIDIPVKYVAHQDELDAALLAVDTPRLADRRLLSYLDDVAIPLGYAINAYDRVRIGGFPQRNPARYPTLFSGRVETADALIGRTYAIRAFVPEFAARYPELPDGMSGGPLLRRLADSSERVVGIVSSYPRARGDQGATGGTVLCRRIGDLREAFPGIAEALLDEEPQPARVLAPGNRAGRVYIAGTRGELDAYRAAAAEVCRRHGLTPVPSSAPPPGTPMSTRERLIDSCEILVLLLGDRYGERSPSEDLAYIELEYGWARSRGLTILLFQAIDGLPWAGLAKIRPEVAESAADATALRAFKERIAADHEVIPFWDLNGFRLDLYQSIELHRPPRPSGDPREDSSPKKDPLGKRRRHLPSPPAICAMPSYVGGSPFTGREHEMDVLDDWAGSQVPILVVEAIGGTGKSALTWEWTVARAAAAMPQLAGTFWWSFYDGSASIERFLRELIAYLRGLSARDASRITKDELPAVILSELRARPFLIVLDGFERLLMAYHQYDPSKVTDYDVDEDRRQNKHSMIDPAAYELVRRLTGTAPSKVLVSTRMVPDALQSPAGDLMPGVRRLRLPGLRDADTLDLLSRLGVHADAESAAKFFEPLGNHPLLIAIVAGMVRDYRPAPGNFGAWAREQPFDIRTVNLTARRNHVLDTALAGLDPEEHRLLGWLSVLPGSVRWEVLESINPYLGTHATSPATAGALLDSALRDLEIRGLLWWNRVANTYDMHPVVRAYTHERLDTGERISANQRIGDYFQALPPPRHETITSVEDLEQTITLFRALTGAGQYGSARNVWDNQLAGAMLVNLGANSSIAELLQPYEQTTVTSLRADLSISLHLAGRHERGLAVELGTMEYLLRDSDVGELRTSLGRAATHYRAMGELARYATIVAMLSRGARFDVDQQRSLVLRQAILDAIRGYYADGLGFLGTLGGELGGGNNPWLRGDARYWEFVIRYWSGDGPTIRELMKAEGNFPSWRHRLRLTELKFEILMRHEDFTGARQAADDIDRLRRIGGQEAMPAENAQVLARLGLRADAEGAIRECTGAMLRVHPFDRPYYGLAHSLRSLGRDEEAVEMAQRARRRAWANGPSYSYHWDLQRAEALLAGLGAVLPPLPAAQPEDSAIPLQRGLEETLR
jgi:hypothetical protein